MAGHGLGHGRDGAEVEASWAHGVGCGGAARAAAAKLGGAGLGS
jgi:hypothetical protein